MAEIPQTAFVRFRDLGERYRQAINTENGVRKRLHDANQTLHHLKAERERLAKPQYTGIGIGGRLIAVDNTGAIAEVGQRIKATEAAIAALKTEVERAEAHKSDAGDLLGRCSELLLDMGAQRSQLEY